MVLVGTDTPDFQLTLAMASEICPTYDSVMLPLDLDLSGSWGTVEALGDWTW